MFRNHTGSDRTLQVDENAASIARSGKNKASHHSHHSKTPASTTKRRAFGDISNRKTIQKTPHVTKSSKIVPPTRRNKVTFADNHNQAIIKQVAVTAKKLAPVEDVEVSAGRTWSDQLLLEDKDDDIDVEDICKEQELWEQELQAFCEEERTRHGKIRQYQLAMAEKELEEKMEALWKQDDQDLAADLDHLVLESVQSFDDLGLDKEDFGPYSFPDDISF